MRSSTRITRAAGKLVFTSTASTFRPKSSSALKVRKRKALTLHQGIAHKVHRPAQVDGGLLLQADRCLTGQLSFPFARYVQPQLPINPVDRFMVLLMPLTTQKGKVFGKSLSWMAVCQPKKRRYEKPVVTRPWLVSRLMGNADHALLTERPCSL